MKTTKLFDYRTKALIAEIAANTKSLNIWCEANGYLPHHKVNGGWVVIK